MKNPQLTRNKQKGYYPQHGKSSSEQTIVSFILNGERHCCDDAAIRREGGLPAMSVVDLSRWAECPFSLSLSHARTSLLRLCTERMSFPTGRTTQWPRLCRYQAPLSDPPKPLLGSGTQ